MSFKEDSDHMLTHLKPPIPIVDHDEDSKVAAFYANRSVFITGATGFIGKVLIEKLIRSCPRVKRIYILMREKRGKSVHERLADLIKSQCFDRIRQAHDSSSRVLEEKLCVIRGDITQPKLGVAPGDMHMLSSECTIVINSAATIRFVEPIENAVESNIYSVGQLVEFCDELARLEALIHLSTAYSNCHKRDTIREIFYEPPMHGDQIQEAIRNLREIQSQINFELTSEDSGDDMEGPRRSACESQGPKFATLSGANNGTGVRGGASNGGTYDLLGEFTQIALCRSNRPNTYSFTKAIGESYLLNKICARPDRYRDDKIPVAIVRPSIVCGAWREPIVGLVDNYNGPTGVLLAMYTGALQAMPGDGQRVADLVPVDMVTSMVLCAGWFLVEKSSINQEPTTSASKIKQDRGVYLFNFVSGARNPMYWYQGTDLIAELAYRYPSKYLVRLPSSYFIRSGKLYDWYDLINHKLPAYLMDFVKSKLCRQRVYASSSFMAGYTRIKQATDTLTPFSSNQWKFSDANTQALFESLDQIDKQVFYFDVASIDWPQYIRAHILGSRVYLMRDGPENVPAAMRRLQQRRALYWIAVSSLIVLICNIFMSILF